MPIDFTSCHVHCCSAELWMAVMSRIYHTVVKASTHFSDAARVVSCSSRLHRFVLIGRNCSVCSLSEHTQADEHEALVQAVRSMRRGYYLLYARRSRWPGRGATRSLLTEC